MPVDILMIAPMSSVERGLKDYTVHHLPFSPAVAERIRGIVTYSGGGIVDQTLLNALPNVEIIANMGVGFDSVDMAAARARNIIVTNAGASNAIDVAEHAIGLMLDVGRKISFGDRYVRAGEWASKGRIKITHRVSGKKLGIVGLGNIGIEIAKRAAAFDMPIAYHNRKARTDAPYRYVDNVVKLAEESDVLICATPGGDETRHLISGAVLGALGPEGIFVNIGRGTTVDEAAMVTALTSGALGGAGLDVFEDEPRVPEALLTLPNVVLQPHVGGATYEGIAAAVGMLVQNLDLHFAGKPVLTPV
jgi:hydroxypyruvate reductase